MPKIAINDSQIAYESIRVANAPEDTILIFLHEALGSIPQWRSWPQDVCKRLKMNALVYERQGHGSSTSLSNLRTSSYLHDYAYDELNSFIETLLPPEMKIILVGHSDGGTISLLYASKFPKRVKAVITMAAHVINEAETVAGIEPAVAAYEAGKLDKLRSFHGEKTDALFYAWANTWRNHNFKEWNICNDIGGFTCPSLIIQGKSDQYGTEQQLNLIKSNVKGACTTVLLDDCSHHPHLEKGIEVIDLIEKFLANKNPF